MKMKVGAKAAELSVDWVKDGPVKLADQTGKVTLIEVFQVNCAHCFLTGLPDAIRVYNNFSRNDVTVVGVATSFDKPEFNNKENLMLLLDQNKVIGDVKVALGKVLFNGEVLPYKIPFPIAIDKIKRHKVSQKVLDREVPTIIPFYDISDPASQIRIKEVVRKTEESRTSPKTFTQYGLEGTPASILIDRKGIIREISVATENLISKVAQLLSEPK